MNTKDVAKITARFKLADGSLQDPGSVTMIVTPPGEDPYEILYPDAYLSKASDGVFVGLVPILERPGRWRVEMVGTGAAAGAGFTTFYAFD